MKYTDRVELCEDGMYRWYYDLDMRKDHRLIVTPLKVLAVTGIFMLVMVQFLPYHSGGMSRLRVMGIMGACFALITAITLGICLIQFLVRNGNYRYRFEMGPEGIRVLMDEGDTKAMQALGTAAEIMSLFTSSAAHTTTAMRAAQRAGYTSFRSVRKAAVDRAKDCIKLKPLLGENGENYFISWILSFIFLALIYRISVFRCFRMKLLFGYLPCILSTKNIIHTIR